jgi:hypothetical protein
MNEYGQFRVAILGFESQKASLSIKYLLPVLAILLLCNNLPHNLVADYYLTFIISEFPWVKNSDTDKLDASSPWSLTGYNKVTNKTTVLFF